MSLYLMWPEKEQMLEAGFQDLSGVPFVLRDDWSYHDEASWFIRDRALLAYKPGLDSIAAQASGKYPTRKSLEAFGRSVINFLEWCEARHVRWQDVEFTSHLINGYQAEMMRGSWSSSGNKLNPNTVNGRVSEALHFLDWAGQRGLREHFQVLTVTKNIVVPTHRNTHGHQAMQKEVRAGRVRPNPSTLRLPTDEEVKAWHRSVTIESGFTKGLMCEVILKTAIRREEVSQWRVDTLPIDRADWQVRGDNVTVAIMYGTKGGKDEDEEGLEYGPSRSITFPLSLAERLAHYREFVRPVNWSKYVRAAKTDVERRERRRNQPKRLFLSDAIGRPVTASRLYEAWVHASRCPFPGWSPHGGRHYWACKTLIKAIERHRLAVEGSAGELSALSPTWITGCATDTLMLEIRPQLGHIDLATTEMYIQWVTQTYAQSALHDAHLADLEGIAETQSRGEIDG